MVDKLGALLAEKTHMPTEMRGLMVDQLRENGNALARGLVGGTLDFTKGLVLVVIYMLFIFAEQAVFRRKILAIAGHREHDAAVVLDTIGRGIQRYLGVKTLVSFVTGALAYAALVALGVPRALLFGILTFLLNYIPTFGSIIAAIFPTVTALTTYPDQPGVAVGVVVVYLAINLTLGNFIEPKILGRELNLSPLVIIISVVVWAGLWGPVGTFLAVPLTAGLQIVLASYESTRPVAVMMSSRPPPDPDEAARGRRRRRRRSRDTRELDGDEPPGTGEGAERRPA
jgi:predicted PurR-regulated permease PerM